MKERTQTDWHEFLMVSVLVTICIAPCLICAVEGWKRKLAQRATSAQTA